MQLIHAAKDLAPGDRKVCLAIGFFDGLHLGHEQIIRQTIADARQHDSLSFILTFDQHPNTVVAPDHVPPLIQSLSQRIRAIESLGADALLVLRFDRQFSEQPGEAFIRNLAHDLCANGARLCEPQNVHSNEATAGHKPALQSRIQSICVGADFVFGHIRSGNVELLKRLGEEMNFTVHGIAAVSFDGQVVSSTRIREAIRAGDLDAASQMLGRAYLLTARVVKGDQLGTKLGFPTANLDVSGLVLPPNGVYAAHVTRRTGVAPVPNQTPAQAENVYGDRRDARPTHPAVLNIGHRPTIANLTAAPRVEVHLLDFQGDLYGQELEVAFVDKLRDERRFPDLDALKSQITRDILDARGKF